MEQGKYEDKIIDQCLQTKTPIPDKILNAPELQVGQEFYLSAWDELSYDRPMGFGVGYIPSASLRTYIRDCDLTEDQEFLLRFVIRRMDNWYVGYMSEKNK